MGVLSDHFCFVLTGISVYTKIFIVIIQNRTYYCNFLCAGDALGHTASEEYTLAVSSLGALTWYKSFCNVLNNHTSYCINPKPAKI